MEEDMKEVMVEVIEEVKEEVTVVGRTWNKERGRHHVKIN